MKDKEDLYPVITPNSRKPDKEIIKNDRKAEIKNPYASRGLDKFSELLADLEKRKKRIYSKKDAEQISSVRFTFSSSNDVIPIVIKSKDHKKKNDEENPISLREMIKKDHDKPIETTKSRHNTKSEFKIASQQDIKKNHDEPRNPISVTFDEEIKKREQIKKQVEKIKKDHDEPRSPISVTFEEIKKHEQIKKPVEEIKKPEKKISLLRQACHYGLVVIVLILVLLAFVGRSMAILLTSLGWYIVPLITAENPRKLRRLDENETASDGFTKEEILEMKRSSDHGLLASPRVKIDSPRHRVYRNSW